MKKFLVKLFFKALKNAAILKSSIQKFLFLFYLSIGTTDICLGIAGSVVLADGTT
ncbi:hypothetical protein [Komagataeibacter diospyri]|uniref:hypothetical protein n=1 Tax=Komagataeibacter diospyri TaxID=1932662 RepID=UPI0037580226